MSYDTDAIHKEMLAEISDSYQKTVGFPTYDLTRAFALAVKSLGDDVDLAKEATDVDNLTGDELTRWCSQRKGVTRKAAQAASGIVNIVTGNGSIAVGDLFESTGGVQFAATEAKNITAGAAVAVAAVVAGAAGNVAAGSVTLMPVTLTGISVITNEAAMSGGYDEESDSALRERYYAALAEPTASGNKAAYKAWALEISGVGRAKIYPLALGDNTVEVCIIDSSMEPASAALIAEVQAYIDPGSAGTGEGVAPLGAYCTVTTATATTINIACTVTLASGYTADTVLANVEAAITAYLQSVAFVGSYVSYAKIANCVNDAEGVLDYTGLTVNSGTANIAIADRSVPKMGTVTIA